MKKKVISSLLTIAMVFAMMSGVVLAEETDSAITVSAAAAILIDAETGTVLYESNADERVAQASITKIMTVLLVVEAIDRGEISLEDEVTCSATAAAVGGSQIWIAEGEVFTVDELLKATLVNSANDAATQLAEYVSGTEEAFVELMNQRAAELGMTNTNFENACGLDSDNHYSSARDIATLTQEALNNPLIFEYSGIWLDYLRDGETMLANTNSLLNTYDGMTGLKTGTTDNAGYCLCATATRDGSTLIAVVLGSESSTERFDAAETMLDYGFNNFTSVQVELSSDYPTEIAVNYGTEDTVSISYGTLGTIIVENSNVNNIEYVIELPDYIEAPANSGEQIGRLLAKVDGEIVGEYIITLSEDVAKMTFWDGVFKLICSIFGFLD